MLYLQLKSSQVNQQKQDNRTACSITIAVIFLLVITIVVVAITLYLHSTYMKF